MPPWTPRDERQYNHIKKSNLQRGMSDSRAEEIAARTVNKLRREHQRTPQITTQGTGNPNHSLEDRTVKELHNLASELNIQGRSKMNKSRLVQAIRGQR